MRLMVDVPYVSTDQLLQCCTLMQSLEEQQRCSCETDAAGGWRRRCPSNVYILTPTQSTLLDEASQLGTCDCIYRSKIAKY